MNVLTPEAMAVLEKLTDPTAQAIADTRVALDDLRRFVAGLKSAKDEKGKDRLDLLVAYLYDADDAFDRAAELIEETRG